MPFTGKFWIIDIHLSLELLKSFSKSCWKQLLLKFLDQWLIFLGEGKSFSKLLWLQREFFTAGHIYFSQELCAKTILWCSHRKSKSNLFCTHTTGLAFNSMMFLAWISSWRILTICEYPKLKTFVCKKTSCYWAPGFHLNQATYNKINQSKRLLRTKRWRPLL